MPTAGELVTSHRQAHSDAAEADAALAEAQAKVDAAAHRVAHADADLMAALTKKAIIDLSGAEPVVFLRDRDGKIATVAAIHTGMPVDPPAAPAS